MEREKLYQVRFGGLGGQGVITGCRILGDALSMDGYNVLQTQAFGIEARGGAACGEVLYSHAEINKLRVTSSDILLALSASALDTYADRTREGSFIIYDSHMIPDVRTFEGRVVFHAPFTEIAHRELGGDIYTNLVALGFVNALTGAASLDSLKQALATQIKANFDNNFRAIQRGYEACADLTAGV